MMKETTFKGVQIFYHDCCTTEQEAIKYGSKENAKNYAKGKVNRLKGVVKDHKHNCKVND